MLSYSCTGSERPVPHTSVSLYTCVGVSVCEKENREEEREEVMSSLPTDRMYHLDIVHVLGECVCVC